MCVIMIVFIIVLFEGGGAEEGRWQVWTSKWRVACEHWSICASRRLLRTTLTCTLWAPTASRSGMQQVSICQQNTF